MHCISKKRLLAIIFLGLSTSAFVATWKAFSFESTTKDVSDTDMLLSCDDFNYRYLKTLSPLAEGWTKVVYKGFWRGVPVAIKTVNERGNGMERCKGLFQECINSLQEGLVREAKFLMMFKHTNIIKLYGFCFKDADHSLERGAMLVELGKPMNSFSLVQTSFRKRLQLAKDMCSLLMYFATHSSGAIALPDLRLQQFVVVDDRLKLCDLDDLQIGDKICKSNADCVSYLNDEEFLRVDCIQGKCEGLNDAMNVWRACRSVFSILLPYAAPKQVEKAVNKTLECKKGNWRSKDLQNSVLNINDLFYASVKTSMYAV